MTGTSGFLAKGGGGLGTPRLTFPLLKSTLTLRSNV